MLLSHDATAGFVLSKEDPANASSREVASKSMGHELEVVRPPAVARRMRCRLMAWGAG